MGEALRLIQLTDCHLSASPDAEYRGHNPDTRLRALEPAIRAFSPAWIVLTGDLAEDGSSAAYQRLCAWLGQFDCEVAWIPGNHDRIEEMAPLFEDAGFNAGPVLTAGDWQFALLDSTLPGRTEGRLDESDMSALDELDPARPAGVFVHHQPVPVGAAWIDKVPLCDRDLLWHRLARLEAVRFVAFGHVHQRFRQLVGGIECLAAPSTVANTRPGTERFEPEPDGPQARWFILRANGRWHSGILSA